MKIHLRHLDLLTKLSLERIDFSSGITYIHGPIGKGKSTVARLVDYCLGGGLERTPALQSEFISCTLSIVLGVHNCLIERGAEDTQNVRVTWSGPDEQTGSVNAPLAAQNSSVLEDAEVFNLSDLIFHFCGIAPIKVRKQNRDPDSQLVRLSFRDLWWYCYLEQTHLDSSFFRLEDPFRGRKSQDAMRFFTGLHSERMSELEEDLIRTRDAQRSKRETVDQIRAFMNRFEFDSETDLNIQLEEVKSQLDNADEHLSSLEDVRSSQIHPSDTLREKLRHLSQEIEDIQQAIADSGESILEDRALRAEFITAKTKSERAEAATNILEDVIYHRCPECGIDLHDREASSEVCRLCTSSLLRHEEPEPLQLELLRRDLNERIDQITDSIDRKLRAQKKLRKSLEQSQDQKLQLDRQLELELARYDSAFIESIRTAERNVATLRERLNSLRRLRLMPEAIRSLEEEAGSLQGHIDVLRSLLLEERERLQTADQKIAAIASEFKRILLAISFPGFWPEDEVWIDPRNWRPTVFHENQEWSFWETGSGGKKTLFNVCYALAVHSAALEFDMPVPTVLIIDSPTKNISDDENPELVQALYREIFQLSQRQTDARTQLLLIDSDFVAPSIPLEGFSERRMAGEADAPSLISYYTGP